MDLGVESRLENIFRSVFRAPHVKINREMAMFDIPGWDSLSNILMILEVEKEFEIAVKPREVVRLSNMGELFDLITLKTKK